MKAEQQPVYSERIVAFIDILGFSALVKQLSSEPSLHAKLHYALAQIRFYKNSSVQKNTAQSKLEVSVFSDSIVISAETDNIHSVLWSAVHLQTNLLALGILLRGGISCGRTIHADDLLYGEGMLDAYHLESKAAIYPRIVLHPKLVKKVELGYRAMFLRQDTDGLWFLDPFSMGVLPPDSDDLLEDGHDPYEVSLTRLGKKIDQEIACISDVGQLAKWNWLKSQHALAVSEFAKFGKPRFWRIWEAFEKEAKELNLAAEQEPPHNGS